MTLACDSCKYTAVDSIANADKNVLLIWSDMTTNKNYTPLKAFEIQGCKLDNEH